jgi:rare lipoprotein A (peptidoglycan hydrolase)
LILNKLQLKTAASWLWYSTCYYSKEADNNDSADEMPIQANRAMKTTRIFLLIMCFAWFGAGCAGPSSQVRPESTPKIQIIQETTYGLASWYGRDYHGRRTASGERFNMYEYTAAHRSLPFGTTVRVTNLRNNRHAVVRINDRGPFVRGRVIDLSYVAARDLKMLDTGVEKVRIDILSG